LQHCLLVCFPQMGKNKRKIHLTLTNRFLLNNEILIETKKMVLKLLRNSIRQNRGKYLTMLFEKNYFKLIA
jgi:hypothetical protein